MRSLIHQLRFEPELVEAMHVIDYDSNWYDINFHSINNELERKIDALLSFMNYICYLKELHLLGKKEFEILGYEIRRTCQYLPVCKNIF